MNRLRSASKRWGTDLAVTLIATAGFLILISTAHCQSCAPDIPEAERRASTVHDGQPGLWFHEKVARCMLQDLEVLGVRKKEISLLKQKLQLRNRQFDVMSGYLQVSGQSNKQLSEALMQSSQQQSKPESILHSDVLWFGIGLAAGGAAAYFIMR